MSDPKTVAGLLRRDYPEVKHHLYVGRLFSVETHDGAKFFVVVAEDTWSLHKLEEVTKCSKG